MLYRPQAGGDGNMTISASIQSDPMTMFSLSDGAEFYVKLAPYAQPFIPMHLKDSREGGSPHRGGTAEVLVV